MVANPRRCGPVPRRLGGRSGGDAVERGRVVRHTARRKAGRHPLAVEGRQGRSPGCGSCSPERRASDCARKLVAFAAQMSTLKEYRSKREQKMTVQHVHVGDGGQAIVGNVNAPAPGGGALEKSGEQPHALGYAPGLTLPREI